MPQDRLHLASPWVEVKEKMKENDIRLTDEDLDYAPGREDELFARIQNKTGKGKDEIKMLIESISTNKGKAG